ncbi:FtsX-like permease family protein [Baia soyae]|uniref:Putative ABC transport system permease protein n=1 Tax=Baia soyae TaxID=1544746 RepID=A0A4R2RV90_9BACL|nr:ABC transporter permease [Baia soyae]TCP68312.1 putative ABC transport system permease protein [Baia soyae]
MNFRQFAFNNVKRNIRAYSAYFLSSSFAVMIFFTYAMFIFHPDMTKTQMGRRTQIGMGAAEYVVFIFSFLFVLYSISAFLKARKKEFGLLTILGSEGRQLKRLIFLENMIIGSLSIIAGIACGMVLSKAFLYFGAGVVGVKELPIYLPWKAMGLTTVAFLTLFLVISALTLFFVRQNRVIELLQGGMKPKPEPKVSIWLCLLSVGCFISAFYLMKQPLSQSNMMYILALGLIATYFFFTQISVWTIRLCKRNRSFSWRGTNLLWVSEIGYKIKDNARIFFMITVVTAMSCTVIGIVLSMDQMNKRAFSENPFALTYTVMNEKGENWKKEIDKIDQELKSANVKFEKIQQASIGSQFREAQDRYLPIMKQSEYQHRVDKLNGKKIPTLKTGEALAISHPSINKLNAKQLTLHDGGEVLQVVGQFVEKSIQGGSLVVVSDETYTQLKASRKEKEDVEISYLIPDWSNKELPNSNSTEVKIGKKLIDLHDQATTSGEENGFLSSRADSYLMVKQSNSMLVFIGIFLAAIFSLSSASFLYFKLFTDLNQDQHIIHGLSKVGLSSKEMKRSATIQIAALFFIPMFVAALEAIIGLEALKGTFADLGNTFLPTMTGIGAFFFMQFIYFFIVRAHYLSQLKRVMV